MLFKDFGEACAAGFLFAFDQKLEVRSVIFLQGSHLFECGEVRDDSRLVVGGAAAVKAVPLQVGFERLGIPESFAHGRLYVMVRIQ